ncbi:serine hydrolase domain-containing protein [Ichthyenterobacterium sp. W332]|uniref:Serine hydrolase domain-containing protein n=1 Tax=Microcosmobacter mediterraneus TaxID=3075607 RepID=A0ABU2YKU6_9FLAO|nr:serine hydrolase domain-containing protein [Ichthyenterobacterium sp. W332]MDT0558787.1 serine hydrolase domain-containing protein [Ichthyenterobacterium sp. W332]
MKLLQYFMMTAFLLSTYTILAQNNRSIKDEIKSVENNLERTLQIVGQPKQTFSIEERMKLYNVPGMSIAVVEDGELRWAKGYGIANSKTGDKVDENTLFQAGSISKPVAALAVMKLYEEGKIDLDEDVNTYLKDWSIPKNKWDVDQKVTLRLLLTHSAGTTVHGFPGYKQEDRFPSIIKVLQGKGNTDKVVLDTIPGTKWRYSGGGYTIMEKVVEDVSNMYLEDYMMDNLFKPLSMTRSTYDQPIDTNEYHNISAAYDGNGEIVEGLWNNYPEQAAAGLWTTPTDLAKYCIEVQKGYNQNVDGVLKSSTIKTMLTKHLNEWGLGPSLEKEGDSLIFQHGGKNNGFTNNLRAYANLGRAVIVMTSADRGNELINEVMLSISEYYNWNLMKPRLIKTIDVSLEDLKKLVGDYRLDYKIPGIGNYDISFTIKDGMIIVEDPNENSKSKLYPIEPNIFIDLESGNRFVFNPEENKVVINNRFIFLLKN